ncbi:hypothetical protein SAMN04488074_119127 [Lentzea albidocapillata subsp. violacea]|uniref:Uncharacterized protein n=2 Tax=Lentzea albidocapillata TaxID=40571 RepID=A0A1G9S5P7_9PSEU|nr:hypothetical protein SAMN04488074_119127 [Lentzea albidocapillata subsp. violacea]
MMSEHLLIQTVPVASHSGEGGTWIPRRGAVVIVTCLVAVGIALYRDTNRAADQEVRRMLLGNGPRRSFAPKPPAAPESERDKI